MTDSPKYSNDFFSSNDNTDDSYSSLHPYSAPYASSPSSPNLIPPPAENMDAENIYGQHSPLNDNFTNPEPQNQSNEYGHGFEGGYAENQQDMYSWNQSHNARNTRLEDSLYGASSYNNNYNQGQNFSNNGYYNNVQGNLYGASDIYGTNNDLSIYYAPRAKPEDESVTGISFSGAIQRFFQKYNKFSGYASRSEYWWAQLFVFLLYLIPVGIFIIGAVQLENSTYSATGEVNSLENIDTLFNYLTILVILFLAIFFATVVPMLAITWRRLHDAGFSGLWYLLALIPQVGWLALAVMTLLPSKPEARRPEWQS